MAIEDRASPDEAGQAIQFKQDELFNLSPDGKVILALDGRVLSFNERAQKQFEQGTPDMKNANLLHLIPTTECFKKEGYARFDSTLGGENDRKIDIEYTISLLVEQAVYFITIRETAPRKIAHAAFRNLSTSFAHLAGKDFFEAVTQQIVEDMNLDFVFVGKYIKAKREVRVLGGWTATGVMGPLAYELDHTPCANVIGNELCVYQKDVQTLFPQDLLLTQMGISGYIGSPIFGKDHEPIGIIVAMTKGELRNPTMISQFFQIFIERITAEMLRSQAEVKLEAALRQAKEGERLKSSFLANMSHEIRTPMNSMLGFIELLQDPDIDQTDHAKFLKILESSSGRLLGTINDIIEISRIDAGQTVIKTEVVKLPEIVREIYEFFKSEATGKGLQFELGMIEDKDCKPIRIDRSKFESILSNLIKNAIKFTHKAHIKLACWPADGRVICKVEDTGIGIPKDRLVHVFDRFVQADRYENRPFEGSGLGLAICKAYVEMMGGRIRVESELNKGSVFEFEIPAMA